MDVLELQERRLELGREVSRMEAVGQLRERLSKRVGLDTVALLPPEQRAQVAQHAAEEEARVSQCVRELVQAGGGVDLLHTLHEAAGVSEGCLRDVFRGVIRGDLGVQDSFRNEDLLPYLQVRLASLRICIIHIIKHCIRTPCIIQYIIIIKEYSYHC